MIGYYNLIPPLIGLTSVSWLLHGEYLHLCCFFAVVFEALYAARHIHVEQVKDVDIT